MASRIVLILGESGSGKSRSIKNLDPEETVIFNVSGDPLPWRGYTKDWTIASKDNPTGNLVNKNTFGEVAKGVEWVNEHRPEIKNIVIDDNQYLSMFTYVNRAYERDYYSKFTDIGVAMVQLAQLCKTLRDDIIVFFLNHVETGVSAMGNEQLQAKTLGKFVKEKITYEGLFKTVLLCDKEQNGEDVKHFFWTRLASSVVKAPEGMFNEQKIPNDLKMVAETIREYYS